MNQNHIKEVFSDEVFVGSLMELETPEQVRAALKEKGVDMTENEILSLRDEIIKQAQQGGDGGEMSLESLDEVAGGFTIPAVILEALGFSLRYSVGFPPAIPTPPIGLPRW